MKTLTKVGIVAAAVVLIGATSVTALAATGYGPRMMTGYNYTANETYNAMIDDADLEAFKAQRLEQMKEYLDAKVAAGTLTQAEADAFLNDMKERQEDCLGTGYGYGMMGGRNVNGTGYGYGAMGPRYGGGCGLYNG